MSKDPAFLFYVGDWLGGTILMNRLQKGAYIDLLMAQFNQGHMHIDQIKTLLGDDFELWDSILKSKFSQDGDGLFYNIKLETEQIKRAEYGKSRRKNFESKKDDKSHMKDHMENEDKKESKSKKVVEIDFVDVILNSWCELYFKHREYEFEVINRDKERSAIGKLTRIFRKNNPGANTEDSINAFRNHFDAVLSIDNQFIFNGASPSFILSQYNQIYNILMNGKANKKRGISNREIEEIANYFYPKTPD